MPDLAPTYDHQIRVVEAALLSGPQVDLSTQMLAHAGIGCRTILVPAGTALTGAATKLPNIFICCGDITVTTPDGPRRLTGFHVLPAAPNFKRAGFAHADTLCSTVWKTDKTDAREMEDEMTDESAMLQTRREGITYVQKKAVEQ